MSDMPLQALASNLVDRCRTARLTLATAESCTGGLIATAITAVPGCSDVFERGFVTYANRAKAELLGVPEEMLTVFGAVSEPVARAMAEGALARAPVKLAVAVTGIAGPSGGSESKPVGLVHIAAALTNGQTRHERHIIYGNRDAIRTGAAAAALQLALRQVDV